MGHESAAVRIVEPKRSQKYLLEETAGLSGAPYRGIGRNSTSFYDGVDIHTMVAEVDSRGVDARQGSCFSTESPKREQISYVKTGGSRVDQVELDAETNYHH